MKYRFSDSYRRELAASTCCLLLGILLLLVALFSFILPSHTHTETLQFQRIDGAKVMEASAHYTPHTALNVTDPAHPVWVIMKFLFLPNSNDLNTKTTQQTSVDFSELTANQTVNMLIAQEYVKQHPIDSLISVWYNADQQIIHPAAPIVSVYFNASLNLSTVLLNQGRASDPVSAPPHIEVVKGDGSIPALGKALLALAIILLFASLFLFAIMAYDRFISPIPTTQFSHLQQESTSPQRFHNERLTHQSSDMYSIDLSDISDTEMTNFQSNPPSHTPYYEAADYARPQQQRNNNQQVDVEIVHEEDDEKDEETRQHARQWQKRESEIEMLSR